MMLVDLAGLLNELPQDATPREYRQAIVEDNLLGKRTLSTRRSAAKLLPQLYALDARVPLFRALRYLWDKDPAGRPLIALSCAVARDPILRLTASSVLAATPGEMVDKGELAEAITRSVPGHFSTSTLATAARNAASSWAQGGLLQGHRLKQRVRPKATPGAVAYTLLLGYLSGASGQRLLNTFWIRLLDTPRDRITELAEQASARGWIVYRQAGEVVEVRFPALLTAEEEEARREPD